MKALNSLELKRLYLEFFREKGHRVIASASLVPEHDPTVLFTTAGMHPLVPYLMGQKHASGKRLADVQKCVRTDDIEFVGDPSHLTFFEMLGNWSLGDYWKKEAIEWSLEFLTSKKWLGLDKEKIHVSVFAGDADAPKDEESAEVWKSLGIPKERIYYFPKKDNWWGPAGTAGPCGPDTEMFYDTGKEKCGKDCRPGCPCGKYFEIWNDVFMQYNKTASGKYEKLAQQNVDTGMGVERTVAVLQGKQSVYEIETYAPIMGKIKEIARIQNPNASQEKSMRIVADHLRAAVFILGDERAIAPSNVDQGYVLRRLIRRAIRHGKLLGIEAEFLSELAEIAVKIHKEDYPELAKNKEFIFNELKKEETRFLNTLAQGLKKFESMAKGKKKISGGDAFLLFQSFGFPIEMTKELAQENRIEVDEKGFNGAYEVHQELSRVGAEKKFRGGLADASEETTKLHTATHLLNEALKIVLKKKGIVQRGSNITPERLRFDFNFERKLTDAELKEIENLVNAQIQKALPVKREEMKVEEAKKRGAQAMFEQKYGESVSVYSIGDFSFEICGGPHASNTKDLGKFRIVKEESSAAGIRRIKAVLE
ncbi:MAG: alanine--tRNA ligase [Candidatus Diapherotrites archaeon]|nr:alanine--tRNA ligase [Candidatus Diapherotrites archaeon]